MKRDDYTDADMEAWLDLNPWDREYQHLVPDTFGFQMFVLGRRIHEEVEAIRAALDDDVRPIFDRWRQATNRVARWWWWRKLERRAKQMDPEGHRQLKKKR